MPRTSDSSVARGVPRIRDHEALRCIGRGAYGEVWLARGVTGVFRAVKVVWRQDYEMDSVFEREFEGIRRYEPVSRTHPGIVDVLQVGRNEDEGFYYYVMELADDVERGTVTDPDTYTPHTFTTEMMHRGPLPLEDCAHHGAALADALGHLHANDLIHRDVKPSNVIYVDGQPRLADIGLVALSGQRSFVGTEGFVPPEGPGTPVADIYSLGMVLYELSTGKDRLDFPDVPTELRSTEEERELWLRVNRVVCRACAAKADDRFQSGTEMAEALRGNTPVIPPKRWKYWAMMGGASAAIAVGAFFAFGAPSKIEGDPGDPSKKGANAPIPKGLMIRTMPVGAEVYSSDTKLGVTPLNLLEIAPGVPVVYTVRMPGYRTVQVQYPPPSGDPDGQLELKLVPWIQPQQGERWTNSLGMEFSPRLRGHISSQPIRAEIYYQFIEEMNRPLEGKIQAYTKDNMGESTYIVSIPPYDAEAFRAWISEQDRAKGYLSPEHFYLLEPANIFDLPAESTGDPDLDPDPFNLEESSPRKVKAYFCVVEKQEYGSVAIRTSPPGAEVYLKGKLVGLTPFEISRVKVGGIDFEIRAQGYEPMKVDGNVQPDALLSLSVDLNPDRGVVFGREWTNSVDMHLVPLGDALMAISETRWKEYRIFCQESGKEISATNRKLTTHPATGVSRYDAEEFCNWLTVRERERGLIDDAYTYRLPTDSEWSRAVGLPPERGLDPASRSARISGVYPWGFEWPPPTGAGNLADRSATSPLGKENVLGDYYDSYRAAAPVMSEDPNSQGLWDLSGNVWEWVADSYGGPDPEMANFGVARGGSWRTYLQEELLSSYRHPLPPNTTDDSLGFRIVLSRIPPPDEVAESTSTP